MVDNRASGVVLQGQHFVRVAFQRLLPDGLSRARLGADYYCAGETVDASLRELTSRAARYPSTRLHRPKRRQNLSAMLVPVSRILGEAVVTDRFETGGNRRREGWRRFAQHGRRQL